MIRVFIFASSSMARGNLENLLVARGVRVVGNSAEADALADQVADAEPDVVLIDASREPPEAIFGALSESDLASDTPIVMILDE